MRGEFESLEFTMSFLKPENALKRAEDLIKVGQKQEALNTLQGLITSKRHRSWQNTHELIMFKYVELCVEMRKGQFARDGLIQYRSICQNVNVSSLEEVIKHFINLSTKKVTQACSEGQTLEQGIDVDDLEAYKRPEDLMMSYVSGEKGKDRSDWELVIPQFKFLWESYRIVLDILRNNSKFEAVYADQPDRPDLSSPESLQLYLRLDQLEIAAELELWKEAFRSAEDIHGLMCMSFHKSPSQKDMELIASAVVLSALSVPPYESNLELEQEKEINLRRANLLSRSSLLAELESEGVMSYAAQEVKDIYYLLEQTFLPSDLELKVTPLLNKISKVGGIASSILNVQLSTYVPELKKLATLRLLQQVSNEYQTMKIENLAGMIPFFDFSVVEKISVDAVKHKFLSMKIDHMKKVVIFGKKSLEADDLSGHLANFAEQLNVARQMICPPDRKQSKLELLLPSLLEAVDKEHKVHLARKSIIEKRKEDQEQRQLEMEQEKERIAEQAAEQMRLATEQNNQRIRQEIAEREHEKAEERRNAELILTKQLRKRQEMKNKWQKLATTLDYLERAKREEAAPFIEAAYQQRLVEEKILHEHNQLQEIELSKLRHAEDLNERKRFSRMAENKEIYKEIVVNRQQVEFNRLKSEREQEREKMRKLKYYLQLEEERQQKLHAEEEARKLEEAERKKKEEAERKAKLDEIYEKRRQREREIEEKAEKQKREALLGRPIEPALRPYEPPARRPLESGTAASSTSKAPAPGKYVPRFRRGGA
ncbi:eukaryotic translation initiation factor 3 subunit a [Trifolium pratense]|uniref:Eukaryotic translation initiation factor 3 subunit a n=1 Tax=Trifolium pratense TaxID=57577 RepID=A0A2K3P893_TRIPR|nr:eukaryotic translation initiation factor 3 subunit a [Trifolium pratense]